MEFVVRISYRIASYRRPLSSYLVGPSPCFFRRSQTSITTVYMWFWVTNWHKNPWKETPSYKTAYFSSWQSLVSYKLLSMDYYLKYSMHLGTNACTIIIKSCSIVSHSCLATHGQPPLWNNWTLVLKTSWRKTGKRWARKCWIMSKENILSNKVECRVKIFEKKKCLSEHYFKKNTKTPKKNKPIIH